MRLSNSLVLLSMSIVGKRVAFAFGAGRRTYTPSLMAFASFTTNGHNPRSRLSSTSESTEQQQNNSEKVVKPKWIPNQDASPWSRENLNPDSKLNKSRFRQHVNPLASKFQMPTEINDNWPQEGTFSDPSLPLFVDIGCGKGGFLLDLCSKELSQKDADDGDCETRNYLGLEIRPSVAQYAKERIAKWNLNGSLDFIGCNANVDLDRILGKYTRGGEGGEITMVSIQYPDPHFKKSHQKRRVVTPELVEILAKHLPPKTGTVFIQSDIKDVLDSMRETLRESGSEYFEDALENVEDYLEENPIGVQTEREKSVLEQNLPVYRTIFRRTENII